MRGGSFGFGFGPEFWFGVRGGGHRPRGRRRQWFDSGDMKYVILKVLRDRPMHGYEVMKALEEETSGCYKPSPGTVYPTLQWLEDEGLVRASDVDGKKVYAVTESGIAFLDEHKDTVDDIFERIGDAINRFVGEPIVEVNKGVGRVAAEAYRAAWKLGPNDERRHRIVDILERAARELKGVVSE
jgi:DNA-binding PadR family transcriptional regulator